MGALAAAVNARRGAINDSSDSSDSDDSDGEGGGEEEEDGSRPADRDDSQTVPTYHMKHCLGVLYGKIHGQGAALSGHGKHGHGRKPPPKMLDVLLKKLDRSYEAANGGGWGAPR